MGAWLTLDEDEQPSLGGAQGLNELINMRSFLLTGPEFSSLIQELLKEGKSPLVFYWCHVANVLGLEGCGRVYPGVQLEQPCNVGQVSASHWLNVIGDNSRHNSHFSASTSGQVLEEGYILAQYFLLHWWKGTSQVIWHKVVTGTWNSPGKLDAIIPRSSDLPWHLPKQIPKHWTIKVASVDLNCIQDLSGMSKPRQ